MVLELLDPGLFDSANLTIKAWALPAGGVTDPDLGGGVPVELYDRYGVARLEQQRTAKEAANGWSWRPAAVLTGGLLLLLGSLGGAYAAGMFGGNSSNPEQAQARPAAEQPAVRQQAEQPVTQPQQEPPVAEEQKQAAPDPPVVEQPKQQAPVEEPKQQVPVVVQPQQQAPPPPPPPPPAPKTSDGKMDYTILAAKPDCDETVKSSVGMTFQPLSNTWTVTGNRLVIVSGTSTLSGQIDANGNFTVTNESTAPVTSGLRISQISGTIVSATRATGTAVLVGVAPTCTVNISIVENLSTGILPK